MPAQVYVARFLGELILRSVKAPARESINFLLWFRASGLPLTPETFAYNFPKNS